MITIKSVIKKQNSKNDKENLEKDDENSKHKIKILKNVK